MDDTSSTSRHVPSKRASSVLALLFTAAPFALAALRILNDADFRFLAMAVTSLVGAIVVMSLLHRRAAKAFAIAAVTWLVTTLITVGTAVLAGATFGPGVWAVAIVFGFCWAARNMLIIRGRA